MRDNILFVFVTEYDNPCVLSHKDYSEVGSSITNLAQADWFAAELLTGVVEDEIIEEKENRERERWSAEIWYHVKYEKIITGVFVKWESSSRNKVEKLPNWSLYYWTEKYCISQLNWTLSAYYIY